MRKFAMEIVGAVVVLSFVGSLPYIIGTRGHNNGPLRERDTMKVPVMSADFTLDPHRLEDSYSMMAVLQIYRGLFRYLPDGNIEPDLAESWAESQDRAVISIKLRERRFSDGRPIVAAHVVHSIARMFHLSASMSADIDYIAGSQEFRESKRIEALGVRALDERTVEFRLKQASPLFYKHLAAVDCAVLPIESFRDELRDGPDTATSGPYRILHHEKGRELVISLRQDWAGENQDAPKRVSFVARDTDSAIREAIETAAISTLDSYPVPADIENTLVERGWTRSVTSVTLEHYIILNPRRISDEVRSWLISRIDKDELLRRIDQEQFRRADGVIPLGLPGALPMPGVDTGADLVEVPKAGTVIELEYYSGSPVVNKVASYLAEVWNTDGVRVDLRPLELSDLLQRMFNKQPQVVIGRRALDYPDGFSKLAYFKSNVEANFFHVNDRELDRAIEQLHHMFDPEERAVAYQLIQRLALRHHTVLPLFFGSEFSGLWSPQIEFVPPHPIGLHTLPMEMVRVHR